MTDRADSTSLGATLLRSASRRDFLRSSAFTAVAAGAAATTLAACAKPSESQAQTAPPPVKPATSDSDHGGGATAPHPATPVVDTKAAADQMDAMHEKGIKAFPAKTEGKGNQLMQPRMDGKVKVFELTAAEIQWEVEPGRKVTAMAYNGQVPGPQIRVKEGDRVRVVLKNELKESTAIHFHGLELPMDQDGVPFITQPPIKPGASYTYEFTVPNSGSHMYHSHLNAAKQVGSGLLGAFVVEPKRPRAIEKVDVDYVMVL